MNRLQAITKGYVYHGAYSRDPEEAKARAKNLRSQGNKAIVVGERDSKYSRGSRGMGYAVYWIQSEVNKLKSDIEKYRGFLAINQTDTNTVVEKLGKLQKERQTLLSDLDKTVMRLYELQNKKGNS